MIGHKHKPEPTGAPMIADVLAVYAEEVAPHKKTARNIAYCINNLLKWWGEKTIADITTKNCRAYAAERPKMAALGDIKILKAAVDYWSREKHPLTGFPFGRQNVGTTTPKDRWLTRSGEAAQSRQARSPSPAP
jgi:hypothetical protein